MNVMLSGGGTGGHIYPALAVAEAIRQKYPDSRLVYVGNVDGMEHELAKEAGYEFIPVSVAGFKGRGPLQMAVTPAGRCFWRPLVCTFQLFCMSKMQLWAKLTRF